MKPFRLLSLFFCLCPIAVYAQSAEVGGAVQDPSGAVIPKASVEFRNQDTGVRRQASTNGDGLYHITGIDPGKYDATVQAKGFKTLTRENVVFQVGDKARIDFKMQVGDTSQSITVDGSGQQINTTDGSVSTVIDRNFVENMPLNGRSFQSLMTLAPGVAQVPPPDTESGNSVGAIGEIVVNGQRTESNYFTVDGVSVTAAANNEFGAGAGAAGAVAGETALGTTQSLVSIDALEEFRATTSTYSAEYGRTPGGQFSFTTRSGTNDWHGSAYDYLRNDAMDANNWFNDYYSYPKEKERQNDFGGTLGGPILIPDIYNGKNKTFFFASYEGLRLVSPQAATPTAVPDTTLRQNSPAAVQPVLKAFPIQNDGEDGLNDGFAYYIEAVSDPATINNTSVRIDHSFSDSFKIFGRYADTPSSLASYNAAVEETTGLSNHIITMGSTNIFSPRLSNELRFNFTQSGSQSTWTSTALGGASPINLSSFPGPGGNSFPTSGSELIVLFEFGDYVTFGLENVPSQLRQFNVTDSLTKTVARHTLKVGVDWRRLATTLIPTNPEEEVLFTDESQILSDVPPLMADQAQAATSIVPVYLAFSSFAQDEWKASDRLGVSLGLRWDVDPAPHSMQGPSPYTVTQITDLATTQLAPAGTPLWKTDWSGLAPRVGLAYSLRQGANHATVLRTGFGVFYDMGNTQGSIGYNGVGIRSTALYSSTPFPLTSAQLAVPPPSVAPPYNAPVFAFDPNLKLPYSFQYNAAIEQSLGRAQSLTINYVGSGGRRLLTEFFILPASLGNTNFSPSGQLALTQGRASSSYSSLQVKYQRALAHGLQALGSYTWSHSIDDASSNFGVSQLLRASSDFDIREDLQGALTYEIPKLPTNALLDAFLGHWGIDMRFEARSALPVDVLGTSIVDPTTGVYFDYQPNRVANQPFYLYGSQYPGGRVLNYYAFQQATTPTNGNLPRNAGRAFDAVQADTAFQRNFQLFEHTHLQFRAEAFNILNHPMFGSIYNELPYGPGRFGYAYNTLNSALGGLNPLYQIGGPRSLQVSLRLSF
jgi:hypothetical protein